MEEEDREGRRQAKMGELSHKNVDTWLADRN